ncbi:flagellum-specific ATP synthase FliI, partial [Erwinia amylovora]|nr:flagellum-specific ATP synthase FliI [Erwinia amylovora]
MTRHVKSWLDTIERTEAKMGAIPAFRRYGRLTRATGLVMEAVGLKLPSGAICVVERQTRTGMMPVECEVVG